MSSDKPDIYSLQSVSEYYNQSVFIVTDIKYKPVIPYVIG